MKDSDPYDTTTMASNHGTCAIAPRVHKIWLTQINLFLLVVIDLVVPAV